LFNVLTENTRGGSKNLLQEQQDVAKRVRKLFLEIVDAEVEKLQKEGIAKGTHLDKALELDLEKLAVGRPIESTMRGYGIAVRNHLKADCNRALKRTYTQYVQEQLALRNQTLTHKVGQKLVLISKTKSHLWQTGGLGIGAVRHGQAAHALRVLWRLATGRRLQCPVPFRAKRK
jgi:hypothetical protein